MANRDKRSAGATILTVAGLIGIGLALGYWTMPDQVDGQASTEARKTSTAKRKTTPAASPTDERIISVVRGFLLENPEILQQMSQELQRRQETAQREKRNVALLAHRDAVFALKTDYVSNPAGKIPVVEFFDYQCGYCKRVHADVAKLQAEQKDVRFIYKEFPILGPVSTLASKAAVASKLQGKYAEYHNALMVHPGGLNEATIFQIAQNVGLDIVKLNKDMESAAVQAEIDANLAVGRLLSVTGTPTLIFGDEIVPGAIGYRQMTKLVERARRDCKVC